MVEKLEKISVEKVGIVKKDKLTGTPKIEWFGVFESCVSLYNGSELNKKISLELREKGYKEGQKVRYTLTIEPLN